MDKTRIEAKMKELSKIISYEFKDINHLSAAMCGERLQRSENDGKNNKELKNEALALVGDAILKFLFADYLYSSSLNKGTPRKGEITKIKAILESNIFYYTIEEGAGILKFAYNDKHFASDPDIKEHEKIPNNNHSSYLEAIAAAIYYDGGFDDVKKWFEKWLHPKYQEIIKHSKQDE